MKSKPILKFLLPLAVIAAAGVAVFQLGLLDRLTGSEEEASAAPAATTTGETAPAETGADPAQSEPAETEPKPPSGLEKLESALEKHGVVVVTVYTPDATIDALQVSEARLGAEETDAGFLALAASKENQIAEFAEAFGIRDTPSVLVFVPGPEAVKRFSDYVDHVTVAQAVHNVKVATS